MPEIFTNILLVTILIVFVGIYVYVAIDLPRKNFGNAREKRTWLLLILLLAGIGSIFYLLYHHKRKK